MAREGSLTGAVETLARTLAPLPDDILTRRWAWGAYDEGVRFALFLTMQELRDLATAIVAGGVPNLAGATIAPALLARHQSAYRDFLGVLACVGDDVLDRVPADGEWPLRTIIGHVMQVEQAFFAQITYALARRRGDTNGPMAMPREFAAAFDEIDHSGDLAAILSRYATLHRRVVRELAALRDDELDTLSLWWEGSPMPVRFRLGRFNAHLREHTIQVEKTLAQLGQPPSEVARLLRLLHGALGDLEGALIGKADEPASQAGQRALATIIAARTGEIAGMVTG